MRALAVGRHSEKVTYPARGERVAEVTRQLMADAGLTLGELAFKAQIDKRDLQRLIRTRMCGSRLEDALAQFFGPAFDQAVMAPVHGARIAAMEADLERRLADAAALHARLEHERATRAGEAPPARVRLVVDRGMGLRAPQMGGGA
jgi:hypothetical protein